MDPERPRSSPRIAPRTRWSLYAGLYAFLCGGLLLLPLGFVAHTLVKVLGLPTSFTSVLVPGTGAVVGAVVWWVVVERRDAYTYLAGGAVGVLTALFTALLWALVIAVVWGPEFLLLAGTLLVIAFVLAVSAPLAFVAGIPLMYARRRSDDGLSGGGEHALSRATDER